MSTMLMLTATVLITWLGYILICDPDGFRSSTSIGDEGL